MKPLKRLTDRCRMMRIGLLLLHFLVLQCFAFADASLPLPSWDSTKANGSVSSGVIPTKPSVFEFVTTSPSQEEGKDPDDLRRVLNQGQTRLHVDKAFQLYVPPRGEEPPSPITKDAKAESPIESFNRKSIEHAIEQTGVDDSLVYLGKSRGEAQITKLRRFTQYMQEQLGREIQVLLLDENQSFEIGILWDELFNFYSQRGIQKSVLLCLGQRDELLKVVLPSARRHGLDESRWLGMIEEIEHELAFFKGARDELPLQTLMKLTTLLHQVEGWKLALQEDPVQEQMAGDAGEKLDETSSVVTEPKETDVKSFFIDDLNLEPNQSEAAHFPWLGSGLAIGMSFVALLAWKMTSRIGSEVLQVSSVASPSSKVIESGQASSPSKNPFAFVASYKGKSSTISTSDAKVLNKNMD